MLTLGIDIAAQAKETAAVAIEWRGRPRLLLVEEICEEPLEDGPLERLIAEGRWTKVAIDAPFGWPVRFVELVTGWKEGRRLEADQALRNGLSPLLYRRTDEVTEGCTRKRPLSVAADKLARPAIRTMHLLTLTGLSDDLTGMKGVACEAYPDAALRCWLGEIKPYKGTRDGRQGERERIFAEIETQTGLEVGDVLRAKIGVSDHVLDALVCALVARACALGLTEPPGDDDLAAAAMEGWIHLPRDGVGLSALLQPCGVCGGESNPP